MGADLKLVVVDYLNLMTASGRYQGNKVQEMGEILRGLKAMAKRENVALLVLAQLNRQSTNRDGQAERPTMAHLRDTGEIEMHADAVFFAYRAAYNLERTTYEQLSAGGAGHADGLPQRPRNHRRQKAHGPDRHRDAVVRPAQERRQRPPLCEPIHQRKRGCLTWTASRSSPHPISRLAGTSSRVRLGTKQGFFRKQLMPDLPRGGFYWGTTDPDLILRFEQDLPGGPYHNIALRTGAESGVVIIDLDFGKGPEAQQALDDLERQGKPSRRHRSLSIRLPAGSTGTIAIVDR